MKLQDILQPKIQKNNANFLLPSFKAAEHYLVHSVYEARFKVQILSEFIPSSPLTKHLPIEGISTRMLPCNQPDFFGSPCFRFRINSNLKG